MFGPCADLSLTENKVWPGLMMPQAFRPDSAGTSHCKPLSMLNPLRKKETVKAVAVLEGLFQNVGWKPSMGHYLCGHLDKCQCLIPDLKVRPSGRSTLDSQLQAYWYSGLHRMAQSACSPHVHPDMVRKYERVLSKLLYSNYFSQQIHGTGKPRLGKKVLRSPY